jgi:hypothetical protein
MPDLIPASSTLETCAAANNGSTTNLELCAAINGGTDNKKVSLQQLSRKWQTSHRDDLKLRHFTGLWLNDLHGPPTSRQAYRKGTLKKYKASMGVGESDVCRMRWLAFEFKSLADLKEKHPKATTWTKVKEVLADLRRPQAGPAVQASSVAKTLVAERSIDQLVGAVRAIQSYARQVGKLTLNGEARKIVKLAIEEMLKDVEPTLGGNFIFLNAAIPGQPFAPVANPDLVGKNPVMQFHCASGELPAAILDAASDSQFKPLL